MTNFCLPGISLNASMGCATLKPAKSDSFSAQVEHEVCGTNNAVMLRHPIGALPRLHFVHGKLPCPNDLVVAQIIRNEVAVLVLALGEGTEGEWSRNHKFMQSQDTKDFETGSK